MARRVTLAFIIVAGVVLALTHGSEVASMLTVARGGSAVWLAVAAVLQAGYYLGYVTTFRQALASVGIRRRLSELTPVMLASVFVNTVTPSAGTAGPALMVDDAVRDGHEPGVATAGVAIGQFTDLAGFAVVMALGFGYLAIIGRLTAFELVAAVAFFALVAVIGGAIVLAVVRPRAVERILLALESVADGVSRRLRRAPARPWASRVAAEMGAAVRLSAERPGVVFSAWGAALLGHALDMGCFVAVGWAFGFRQLGPLIAGYAVGTVVWLTSIVPNGVGIVEGSVAVLLASFGAAPGVAAAVSLVFRGLTFWLPFAAGFVLLPRVSTFREDRAQLRGDLPARIAAVLVSAVGVIDVLSASTPALAARLRLLEPLMPFGVTAGNLAAVLAGIALLALARGLWRHKRMAYLLTLALLAVSAASHIAKGLDYEEATVAIAVLVWLFSEGSAFYARSDAPSVRQGVRVLLGAFTATLAYGTAGFWLLDRHFSVNFGFPAAARQTVVMFTQFYNPGIEPITGFGRYFAGSIYVVGAATVGFALLMLLRPVVVRHPASATELARARAIVEAHGGSSLAAMTLLPDKSLWFSSGGCVVSYVVSNGIAVTLGDPIGPPEHLAEAVSEFSGFAGGNGWVPAFYETNDRSEPGYADAGLSALCIGYEAIVPVAEFNLAGKSHKSLRNRVNRLVSEGYTTEVLPAPQPTRTIEALRAVSDVWLATRMGSEKRFSLGWFDEHYIRDCDVMVVRAGNGSIVAFANLVSEYQANEATIDLMRYRPEAPAGVMDFLFVRLFEWSHERGFATFNMGLSPLAGLGEDPEHGVTERLLSLVYEHGNALYGFRGLHEYKEKFDPLWEPRYLLYSGAALLPEVFAAVVRVNSGEHPWRGYLDQLLRRPVSPAAASA